MVAVSQNEIIDIFGLRNVSTSRDEILCSCPFTQNHRNGDAHPSFRLNSEKGVWICFGCGERGNLVQLAQRVLGMSPIEAHRMFDEDLSEAFVDSLANGRAVESRREVTPVQADVGRWARNRCEYWHKRGFTDETIGKWQLGYSPEEHRAVVPVYFGRELVGWSMRALDDETQPKWKHSPGLPKSEMLFGMDNFTDDCAVLVEAPLSVVMLDQYGIHNAVASFGCKLSERQSRLLRSNYNSVFVFYDPDAAGQEGMRDAVLKLEDFMDVYVVPVTRDDPAAMTLEEDWDALRSAVPSWALGLQGRG